MKNRYSKTSAKFKRPIFGEQRVQTYHPERGYDQAVCVSTYGVNGWLVDICSPVQVAEVKQKHIGIISGQAA